MPNDIPQPDELNNLTDKRSAKDRRLKSKPRFDDEDENEDNGRDRRDRRDRRGSRTHRSLHNDDD